MRALFSFVVVSLAALIVACSSCTSAQTAAAQRAVSAAEAASASGAELTQCALGVYAADQKAGKAADQIAADELAQCSRDADALAQVIDSHEAANIALGLAVAGTAVGAVSSALHAASAPADAGAPAAEAGASAFFFSPPSAMRKAKVPCPCAGAK